jgi:predicted acyl esterase
MRLRFLRTLALTSALSLTAAAGAQAADPPPGSTWSEATIPSAGGVQLHADILRPSNLSRTAKTPVILSIGPYFNHAGQVGAAGPVADTSYDPAGPSTGPNDRFYDFIEGAKLMKRGYTWIQVDLRGFGGSTGCLDWGGPGEQSDVVNAVQWAARQPWSNGKVGMYGKSYDGVTGLIGVDKRPAGLAAVVSQEPVYDLYRYLYGDGMRRLNSALTPALYDAIDATPGPLLDTVENPLYIPNGANDTQRPGCKALNWLDQAGNDDHFSPYWRARNLIPGASGSNVPLFLTQGLTENNTVADGTAQYLRNHPGYERAWLGPWEHVRGGERDEDGRLKMGRAGWYDETIRFYDRFLKGVTDADARDPKIAVQTNDGTWRAENVWPPADSTRYTSRLNLGTYNDDGSGPVTGSGAEEGLWTVSRPLPYDAHLSGSGVVNLDVSTTVPRANLVVDVYDLDEYGIGPLITRQGHMIRESGQLKLDLWSADWKIRKGHRIAVRVTDANDDWYVHVPTSADVTVHDGSVTLPFLRYLRTSTIQGDAGVQLAEYLDETVELPGSTIKAGERRDFALPPRQRAAR